MHRRARIYLAGKSKLLWRFDVNLKSSTDTMSGQNTRNIVQTAPVVWEDHVYVVTGRNPEHGEGSGLVWCIDPRQRGDISGELGTVWTYASQDLNADGELEFEESMHRTCGAVAIQDGLLFVADLSGLLHCLDTKTTHRNCNEARRR